MPLFRMWVWERAWLSDTTYQWLGFSYGVTWYFGACRSETMHTYKSWLSVYYRFRFTKLCMATSIEPEICEGFCCFVLNGRGRGLAACASHNILREDGDTYFTRKWCVHVLYYIRGFSLRFIPFINGWEPLWTV